SRDHTEVVCVLQEDWGFLDDRGAGGIRREAQHEVCTEVADVIRAAGDLRARAAVVARGADAYAHPGVAGDALDVPDEHHRAEHAAVLAEPRREIRDLDRATLAVVQP